MKKKKDLYTELELRDAAEADLKNTGGAVEYKGKWYYRKPLEKILAIVNREKEKGE